MSNRLVNEKSPYLQQHAENPVDWYPWSEEAFELAKREDKPVFLSIGYATCHWCHVMAHESFEDDEVAERLNRAFVNIKVDREERPDIDNTYMTVCQLLTGQGGWPLTVLLTPEKKPFFAATYIPKETRFNRIGMKDLIPQISAKWKQERQNILQSADKITSGFAQTLDLPEGDEPGIEQIKNAKNALKERFDPEYGGFGTQPKFPSPHNLSFLMQYSHSFDDPESSEMVWRTLEQMRLGGIYDQIGFGFHRYSTDRQWLLPHFEKMLYDQALMMIAYSEGWKYQKENLYKTTVRELAGYTAKRLTSDAGAFYSAEDADSEGEEGKFYVWTLDEIQTLLPPGESALFSDLFNLEPDGNFRDEASGKKTGANIPHLKKRPELLAKERETNLETFVENVEAIRKKLQRERSKRIRPFRDDKVLADWNGLMISALAKAGALFEEESFIQSAERAWNFIEENLFDHSGNLLHRFRNGEAAIPAMADDYAFLIRGLIELHQATLKPEYLQHSVELNQQFIEQCLDKDKGGFFFTGQRGETLLGRQKEIYDGAIPSSNSTAAMNLLRLAALTGNRDYEQMSEQIFRVFAVFFEQSPGGATHAMQALAYSAKPSAEVVVCGPPNDPETRKMIRTVRLELFEPSILHLKTDRNRDQLAELAPYTENYPVKEKPAAYFCRNFTCRAPVYSAAELKKLFKNGEERINRP